VLSYLRVVNFAGFDEFSVFPALHTLQHTALEPAEFPAPASAAAVSSGPELAESESPLKSLRLINGSLAKDGLVFNISTLVCATLPCHDILK